MLADMSPRDMRLHAAAALMASFRTTMPAQEAARLTIKPNDGGG